ATVKAWIKGAGIVFILVGGLSFPVGIGINPKRDTSLFHNLADIGLFIRYGFILIGVGIVLLVVSALIPAKGEDAA
ncbi:MAG: hypothetical protein ACREP8_17610, partial [Candidatus Binatia bacterium]